MANLGNSRRQREPVAIHRGEHQPVVARRNLQSGWDRRQAESGARLDLGGDAGVARSELVLLVIA